MISWAGFSRQIILFPNALSLVRMALGFIIPLFVLSSSPALHLLACLLYALGSMTDYWDGYFARKMNLISDIGKFLDPLADKVLVLGMFAVFVSKGYFSLWWIVPIFLREIIITFFRTAWLLEGKAIGAELLGKLKLTVQVAAISFCLFKLVALDYSDTAGLLEPAITILIFSSTVITVISGITFLNSNKQLIAGEYFFKFVGALGVGLMKPAPGTWGSALAIPVIFLSAVNGWLYLLVFILIFIAGGWAVKNLNLSHDDDPGYVVTDEACGMMVALWGLPLNGWTVIAGFILFRLFDIFKPFPLRRLEKLHGYWGIMLDDLGAGVYTWLLLWLSLKFI